MSKYRCTTGKRLGKPNFPSYIPSPPLFNSSFSSFLFLWIFASISFYPSVPPFTLFVYPSQNYVNKNLLVIFVQHNYRILSRADAYTDTSTVYNSSLLQLNQKLSIEKECKIFIHRVHRVHLLIYFE